MKTATNPDTGETVVLVGDQWQKAEKTATGEGGAKAYLVGGQWMSDEPAPSNPLSTARQIAAFATAPIGGGLIFGHGGEVVDKAAYDAGGKVTDAASKILPPEAAAAAGYATNLGVQALPMLLGGSAAKEAAPLVEGRAQWLMNSALKPTWEAVRTGKAAKAIDTMLDEGISVSKGGVEKLRSKIGEINQQITDAISNSSATIDKTKVADYLREPLKKFSQQVNPNSDISAIKSAWQEFLDHPMLKNVQDIPVQAAQELKQGTYKALGNKSYGELKGAETEAQKTLARGLKEEIAGAVPGVGNLNKAESELINALSVTERRALMQLNNNPGGLAWLSHNPASWAAFMADKSSLFKSLAARALYSGSEQIPATAARLGIGTAEALNNPGYLNNSQ